MSQNRPRRIWTISGITSRKKAGVWKSPAIWSIPSPTLSSFLLDSPISDVHATMISGRDRGIVYRVEDKDVLILRVARGRRDLDALFGN